MRNLSKKETSQATIKIPKLPTNSPTGGSESNRIVGHLNTLAYALDKQANIIDEFREKAIGYLLRPLVDEDSGSENPTGEEYENSTAIQEEVEIYVHVLRAIIADRSDALSGLENALIAYDVKATLRVAEKGAGPQPARTLELYKLRLEIKPTKEMGSVRGVISDLRGLATSLRTDVGKSSARAQIELNLVEKLIKTTLGQLSEQTKATIQLEKELDLFISLMNTRLEYYRQLQAVSDMVSPYEGIYATE